ncbi:hypothetical protein BJ508DRAFT_32976 [Ascobolus immersus RN42]|uniref:Uncharacterized protein n=1 Tax=Ascobolus immersus RN42 TaxID=1160509 RepID=A0A3N4IFR1_ASCIM|nr:hypothetical protein BJ508DRAFT_32976 [Ascobolus immersus RN42]
MKIQISALSVSALLGFASAVAVPTQAPSSIDVSPLMKGQSPAFTFRKGDMSMPRGLDLQMGKAGVKEWYSVKGWVHEPPKGSYNEYRVHSEPGACHRIDKSFGFHHVRSLVLGEGLYCEFFSPRGNENGHCNGNRIGFVSPGTTKLPDEHNGHLFVDSIRSFKCWRAR